MQVILHQHKPEQESVLSDFPKYSNRIMFCGSQSCQSLDVLLIWRTCSHVQTEIGLFIEISWIFLFFKCFKSLQTIFMNSPCPCVKAPIVHLKTRNPWPKFCCSPLPFLLSNTCVGAQNNMSAGHELYCLSVFAMWQIARANFMIHEEICNCQKQEKSK